MLEMIVEAYRQPDPRPVYFPIGSVVRLRKGRSDDGQTPVYWDGAKVEVVSHYCTGLLKEHWYKLWHRGENVTADFREDEIDGRYAMRGINP